jgi:hypothetical protein
MHSLSDSFCETNFQCTSEVVETDTCFIYIKKEQDIDCHIPCELNNCTKLVDIVDECIVYHCMGKLGPADKITHGPGGLILSLVTAIFVFVLCGVVGIFHYKTRQRRQAAAFIDNQNLISDDNNSNAADNEGNNSNAANNEGNVSSDNEETRGAASLPISTAGTLNPNYDFFENVNLNDNEVLPQCVKDQRGQGPNGGHAHSYVNYQCLCWNCTLADLESKNVPLDKFSL